MKELSIEEKAKRYDEALNKLRRFIAEGVNPLITRADVQDFFPELAESEDERIRKRIIHALHGDVLDIEETNKAIAWLEKQGKNNKWKPSKDEMDALYGLVYITNKMDDKKDVAITKLYQDLKREFFNGVSYENMFPNTEDGVRRRSTIQVLEYARSLDNYNQYGKADIDKNIAWLEKQGEKNMPIKELIAKQKGLDYPYVTGWRKNYKDNKPQVRHSVLMLTTHGVVEGEWLGEEWCQYRWYCKIKDEDVLYWLHLSDLENLEKESEQKPADKVEPKFEVGDWITNGIDVCKIKNIDLNEFNYIFENGISDISLVDNICHLWTIKDAKDGDVLAAHECLVLFKEIDGLNIRCYCTYHFMNNTSFYVDTLQNKEAFHPATKEQRDTLERAITNAGYTFDFKKKELKKIEQNPAWSEEDEEIIEALISLCDEAKDNIPQLSALKNWLNSLKDRVQPQPKQSEQNLVLRDTFGYEDGRLFGMNEGIGLVLDNPEKYGLQKPVKWSKEDESVISLILSICNDFLESFEISPASTKVVKEDIDKIKNWLKSLRPQTTWRPSEEQVKALKEACDKYWEPDGLDPLYTLYEQLKAL